MTPVDLHEQLVSLRASLETAAEQAGAMDRATDNTVDRWMLRGIEVRLQSASDMVRSADASLRVFVDMTSKEAGR